MLTVCVIEMKWKMRSSGVNIVDNSQKGSYSGMETTMSEVERQSFAKGAKIVWIVVNEDIEPAWPRDKSLLFGRINKLSLPVRPYHVLVFKKGSSRCTCSSEESR